MEKVKLINEVIELYFNKNPSVKMISSKDLMPQFIEAGIFVKDDKKGLPIRKILRQLDAKNELHLIPSLIAKRKTLNTNWFFIRSENASIKLVDVTPPTKIKKEKAKPLKTTRTNSDELYVLDLCDHIYGKISLRQHRFDFLLGDSGKKLPVDAYFPELKIVIEYREYQHTNAVKHFDKPEVITVSGVHRGEQRKIYDQRRRDVLPKNGIKLVEICYSDFEFDKSHRIVRDARRDFEIVKVKVLK